METPPASTPIIGLRTATDADAEALADLRVAAMRESLERVGRFDPVRARDRFLAGFDPASTRHIVAGGVRVGFVVLRRAQRPWLLDHLYIDPNHQGRGIGAAVLRKVFEDADARGADIRVGALKESDSNRFYRRHGFEFIEAGEWDVYYLRRPQLKPPARTTTG